MIDQHIEVLKTKATGLEKRICETDEDLTAEKIISLCKELNETVAIINFLEQIKFVRKKDAKIITPDNKLVTV